MIKTPPQFFFIYELAYIKEQQIDYFDELIDKLNQLKKSRKLYDSMEDKSTG